MLAEIAGAIEASDWPRALSLALARWRDTRSVALANLVDAIAARCRSSRPPRVALGAWWIEHALTYDPLVVPVLVRTCTSALSSRTPWHVIEARHRSGPARDMIRPFASPSQPVRAWLVAMCERLAAVLEWPDDPRTAAMIVRWLVEIEAAWPGNTSGFRDVLVRHLARLRDRRVVMSLRAIEREPRGFHVALRTRQAMLAGAAIAEAVAAMPPVPNPELDAAVEALVATVAPPGPRADEDALWRDLTAHPDDDGPRLVLGDVLCERRDPRGAMFVLQRPDAGHGAAVRAKLLVKHHWERWLGDVALVITKRGSEFQRGMLAVVRVGMHSTPDWAWSKLAGHREMSAVHTVLAHQLPAARFAEVLDGIDHDVRRVGLDSHALIAPLRARRARWPARALDYSNASWYPASPLMTTSLGELGALFPDVEEVNLVAQGSSLRRGANARAYRPGELATAVAGLPEQFSQLARIRVAARIPGAADLAGLPLVELSR